MEDTRGRKPLARLRWTAVGVALLAWTLDAAALSSGAPRGTPLIGRPLQIAIPVGWDGADGPPPCVRAEFLQGESPGGPLHWRLERGSGSNGLLRLSSSQPVQEPVLTVQIALGCGRQLAREYVLLAEPPNEAREVQAAADAGADLPPAPLSLAASSVAPAAPAGQAAAAAQRTQRAQRVRPAAAQPVAAPQRREATPKTASAKTPPVAGKSPAPRLKLEPIDLAVDEAPVLRLAGKPAPGALAAAGTRAEAPGVIQAPATPPEEQAAQREAAQALQAELKAMRELVQRYGAETRMATQRLETVSDERDLMLNILLGLVLVLGGGFAYLLWLRSHEAAVLRRWWEEEHGGRPVPQPAKAPAPGAAASAPSAAPAPPPDATPAPQPRQGAAGIADELVELPDFLELDEDRFLGVEELLGLKEKADFFLAVGQPEKAVQLLESQLHEHPSSPFVWLDLLDLCRRLERREEYERLRAAFQKLFSARMPGFDAAITESGGLEDHPRALSRITQLWGTPRVLQVIEESLFEEPKPGSITFDLEATRDLLLLYGIASEALASSASRDTFGGFPSTMHTPLVTAPARVSETEPVPLASLDHLDWPASLVPAALAQARRAPAPDLAPRATEAAGAPDIDLGELDPLLPDDLDFCLSLPPAPPPERAH